MSFIKVTANQCTPQGVATKQVPRSEFYINIDLIGAIQHDVVFLKGASIVHLNGNHYTDLRLEKGQGNPGMNKESYSSFHIIF